MKKSTIAVSTALVAGLALASPASAQRGRASKPSEMGERVRELAQGHLESLKQSGDFAATQKALAELLDQAIRYSTDRELDSIVQAYAPLLMVAQLAQVDRQTQGELVPVLLENEELAWTLAMLVDPEKDDIKGVYRTLAKLVEAHGDKRVAVFDNLAAAISVVHDVGWESQVNENKARPMAPEDIFAYYADHVREMANDPRVMPAELLIYVVDTTENREQMEWALSQYRRDTQLGNRFFEIEYDTAHFEQGVPKAVTLSGEFNLQGIKEHGGVCADQAYFATQVGKAMCVPTAFVWASGAEVAHAWLGYLETRGRRASWNFEAGRYDAYENIRGNLLDPQRRELQSDAVLGLLSQDAVLAEEQLRRGESICAAANLLGIQRNMRGYEAPKAGPDGVNKNARFKPRTHSVEDQLELLEAGLRETPSYVEGWRVLTALAERQELDSKQMDQWSKLIDRLCGREYPDFMMETLSPMFWSVPDAQAQSKLWAWLFDRVRKRPDLASQVLFNQAELMRKSGDPGAAWNAYMEVVNRYANHGTAIVSSLLEAESMIREEKGDTQDVVRRDLVPMYDRAWRQTDKPQQMAGSFVTQSNWYRVGSRLAELLREAGDDNRARTVRQALRNTEDDSPFGD